MHNMPSDEICCASLHLYVCMYMCACICIYTHTYTYTYTHITGRRVRCTPLRSQLATLPPQFFLWLPPCVRKVWQSAKTYLVRGSSPPLFVCMYVSMTICKDACSIWHKIKAGLFIQKTKRFKTRKLVFKALDCLLRTEQTVQDRCTSWGHVHRGRYAVPVTLLWHWATIEQ